MKSYSQLSLLRALVYAGWYGKWTSAGVSAGGYKYKRRYPIRNVTLLPYCTYNLAGYLI